MNERLKESKKERKKERQKASCPEENVHKKHGNSFQTRPASIVFATGAGAFGGGGGGVVAPTLPEPHPPCFTIMPRCPEGNLP